MMPISNTCIFDQQVTEESSRCECSACKVVPNGPSAGTYELVEGQEKMCQKGCLYKKKEVFVVCFTIVQMSYSLTKF